MTSFGGFGIPGQGSATMTTEREIVAQGFDSRNSLFKSIVVRGTTRDAGNTPTTVLRPGLLLGQETANGNFSEWDADAAADGSQDIRAILWKELRAQDFDANNTDRHFTALVGRTPLIASNLLIQGSAFVGHIDEFLARKQLKSAMFQLDDDPFGYLAGDVQRFEHVTGTTDAITASQNGMTLFYNNAASVTATLPTIQPGLNYELIRVGDEEFIWVSAEGDNVVVGNDLSADGMTTTTASEHLGVRYRIKSVYVSTTLKWLVEGPLAPFGTGTANVTYSIQT